MSARAGSGRASARQSGRWAETHPTPQEDSRAILSFTLLLSVIVAGFVISLRLAEANPTLTNALSTILN
jgi:hypothetical protein